MIALAVGIIMTAGGIALLVMAIRFCRRIDGDSLVMWCILSVLLLSGGIALLDTKLPIPFI